MGLVARLLRVYITPRRVELVHRSTTTVRFIIYYIIYGFIVGNLPSIEVDETKESGARPTNEVEGTIHIENEAEEELKQELEPVLEQLATHVPDLIVFRTHDAPLPQTIRSYGVVMFADISGDFRALLY